MRASTRTIRFAVGTALVALGGGCTSKPDGPGSNVGEVRDPANKAKAPDTKTPETKTPDTKTPDTKTPEPAPEDDHVNVGPADDPKDPTKPITKDPPRIKTPEPTKILPTANPGPSGR